MDWIEVKPKGKLPEPYKYVLVKDEDTSFWKSYMYPNGEWKWNIIPKFWKMAEEELNVSCGIYLYDLTQQKLLIGHVTNSKENSFSIPKGMFDETDSSYLHAAIRELQEETSIDFYGLNIIYRTEFDIVKYPKKDKKLKTFFVVITEGNELDVICTSMFKDDKGKEWPEIDYFQWVSLDVVDTYLSGVQATYLENIKEILKKDLLNP